MCIICTHAVGTRTQYKTGISAQAKFNIYEKRSTVTMGIYIYRYLKTLEVYIYRIINIISIEVKHYTYMCVWISSWSIIERRQKISANVTWRHISSYVESERSQRASASTL